jgi:hypothetical protein
VQLAIAEAGKTAIHRRGVDSHLGHLRANVGAIELGTDHAHIRRTIRRDESRGIHDSRGCGTRHAHIDECDTNNADNEFHKDLRVVSKRGEH